MIMISVEREWDLNYYNSLLLLICICELHKFIAVVYLYICER